MTIGKEYRVVLPLTVEEYRVGQLYSVAEASKNETGGGEGVEVDKNEPYENEEGKGQYTRKIYHLESRVPSFVKYIAPKGLFTFVEEAWNAYPYCKTVITNPGYMKDGFYLCLKSWHLPDAGTTENPHKLPPKQWADTEKILIDIANDPVRSVDYKEDLDPAKFHSEKTGRGPLGKTWIEERRKEDNEEAVMCAYKYIETKFKWMGLTSQVEKYIHTLQLRILTSFHRQVFCWLDKWHGMTIEDIRKYEEETKANLEKMRAEGEIRGTKDAA